jgi:hypothetical protein
MQIRGHVTYMRFTIPVTLLLSVFIIYSCTDRSRNNPLDPQNPNTHGQISHVRIYSQEHDVFIHWDKLEMIDLQFIRIYRKAESDSEYKLIGNTSATSNYYVDSTALYGLKYNYYVTAQVQGYESPPSAHVTITPGPTYTWVADVESGYLSRLTHDLQIHIFDFGIMSFPCLIAVSPAERSAWVYSRFSESIYKVNSIGHPDVQLYNYKHVTHMAVDSVTNALWFCIQNEGLIQQIDALGVLLQTCRECRSPKRLAINSRNHNCYVIDQSVNSVVRLSGDGKVLSKSAELLSPQDLLYNRKDDTVWVADSTRILIIDKTGKISNNMISGFFWASLIAQDSQRNTYWIVDLEPVGQNASLAKVDAQGQVLFKLANFQHPMAIAVNEFNGTCLVADAGAGQLYQVSEDGIKISIVGDFYAPYAVAVEHH